MTHKSKTYLVGGAVRDKLLGRKPKELDWVVVGSDVATMLKKGFKSVGKEFPVFIHPKTKDEYALARTERKTGKGYHGFDFHADPSVTLEEDLKRRDLTINAIAKDNAEKLFDPYHGQKDLKNKILRHVSAAFAEDPVRILRVARFSARFPEFTIAPTTMRLMKKMVKSGEVDALVPERVWQEMEKALNEDHPEKFIEVLRKCGALKVIFPEIDALFGVPNPKKHHPEIDSGIHTLLSLQQAVQLTKDPTIRFVMLAHDLGKAQTPKAILPKHHGHEEKGAKLVKTLCKRLHVPSKFQELAEIVTKYHTQCHDVMKLTPKGLLSLLEKLDAFRRPTRFKHFLTACIADARGRKGFEKEPYNEAKVLEKIYKKCAALDTKEITKKFKGAKIGDEIRKKRLHIIKLFLEKLKQ